MELVFGILGYAFIALGSLISIVGLVWHLKEAFATSTGWGIGCVFGWLCLCFIPNIIWLVMNFEEGWRPVLIMVLGGVIPTLVGLFLVGSLSVTV